jgi:hypothetical protein
MLEEEKGTGTICRNGPEDASHKGCLSPFSCNASTGNTKALDGRGDDEFWGPTDL